MDLEAQQVLKDDVGAFKKRLEMLEARLGNGASENDDVPSYTRPLSQPRVPPLANPSPLGLLGFAIVSWLSGLSKLVGAENDGTLGATGIFIGGLAQVIAGLLHFVKNNAHSATVFSIYGLHWVVQGFLLWNRQVSLNLSTTPNNVIAATYYALLTATTVILWIPSLKMNRVLVFTLAVVVGVFFFDAVAAGTRLHSVDQAAGALSCLAATMAFYMCAADVINEVWRKIVLPVFPHNEHKRDYQGLGYVPRIHYHKSITAGPHH